MDLFHFQCCENSDVSFAEHIYLKNIMERFPRS